MIARVKVRAPRIGPDASTLVRALVADVGRLDPLAWPAYRRSTGSRVLVIRDEQARVLARVALYSWVAERVSRLLPRQSASLGPRRLELVVRDAATRAVDLGFGDDELLSYVTLELVFGAGFVAHDRNGWAREALADRAASAEDRIQRLREAAVFHLAERREASVE